MDLASDVVTVAVPLLAQVADGFAGSAGERAFAATMALLDSVRDKFRRDGDAAALEVLDRWQAAPLDDSAQQQARAAIAASIAADEAFGDDVRRQLRSLTGGMPSATFVTETYGGRVGKVVNIGTAHDVRID